MVERILSQPINENRRFGLDCFGPEDFGQDVLDLSSAVLPSLDLPSQTFLAIS